MRRGVVKVLRFACSTQITAETPYNQCVDHGRLRPLNYSQQRLYGLRLESVVLLLQRVHLHPVDSQHRRREYYCAYTETGGAPRANYFPAVVEHNQ